MKNPGYIPSPRYWFLWPGVMILVCYSMAEFIVHWKIIWYGMVYGWSSTATSINGFLAKRGKSSPFLERQGAKEADESSLVEDFATKEQQVANWVWLSGIVVVLAVTVVVFEVQFDINGGKLLFSINRPGIGQTAHHFRSRNTRFHPRSHFRLPLHPQFRCHRPYALDCFGQGISARVWWCYPWHGTAAGAHHQPYCRCDCVCWCRYVDHFDKRFPSGLPSPHPTQQAVLRSGSRNLRGNVPCAR